MITPTKWTDNDLTWDEANPLWPVHELNLAMIEAIKECDGICNRTVPALLATTYNPIRPNIDYVDAINTEVNALIYAFVNHLDSDGDWTGQTAIPNWTQATILAAIGDTTRIIPSTSNVLSPWYYQNYKILNMLKWHREHTSTLSCDTKSSGTPKDWDDAVTAFLAASWVSASTTNIYYAQHYYGYLPATHKYSIYRLRTTVELANTTQYDISYDYYVNAGAVTGSYENNDYTIPEHLYKYATNTLDSGDDISYELGNFDTVTLVKDGGSWRLDLDSPYSLGYIVAKYDGDNGKKFKEEV